MRLHVQITYKFMDVGRFHRCFCTSGSTGRSSQFSRDCGLKILSWLGFSLLENNLSGELITESPIGICCICIMARSSPWEQNPPPSLCFPPWDLSLLYFSTGCGCFWPLFICFKYRYIQILQLKLSQRTFLLSSTSHSLWYWRRGR